MLHFGSFNRDPVSGARLDDLLRRWRRLAPDPDDLENVGEWASGPVSEADLRRLEDQIVRWQGVERRKSVRGSAARMRMRARLTQAKALEALRVLGPSSFEVVLASLGGSKKDAWLLVGALHGLKDRGRIQVLRPGPDHAWVAL